MRTRLRTGLCLGLMLAPLAAAQTPPNPASCQRLVGEFEGQKDWWRATGGWVEAKPKSGAIDTSWSPLHLEAMVHGYSYYVVADSAARRCYVAVCGGTGNICRFFRFPKSGADPDF